MTNLSVRLPLHRIEAGSYQTADGSVRVVRLSKQGTWICLANGEPVSVRGFQEFDSLRAAWGMLADLREELREARGAA